MLILLAMCRRNLKTGDRSKPCSGFCSHVNNPSQVCTMLLQTCRRPASQRLANRLRQCMHKHSHQHKPLESRLLDSVSVPNVLY